MLSLLIKPIGCFSSAAIFKGNAVSAANLAELGAVSALSQTAISGVLTNSSFVANRAASFSFGSRTFVALNNVTAGFQSSSDPVIEITGFSGSLTNLAIV